MKLQMFNGFNPAMLDNSIEATKAALAVLPETLDKAKESAKEANKLTNAEKRRLITLGRQKRAMRAEYAEKVTETAQRVTFLKAARPQVAELQAWVAQLKEETKLQKSALKELEKAKAAADKVNDQQVKVKDKPVNKATTVKPENLTAINDAAIAKLNRRAELARAHAIALDKLKALTQK